jgi:hypothetical protein
MVNALTTYSHTAPAAADAPSGAQNLGQACLLGIDVPIGLDVALAKGFMR